MLGLDIDNVAVQKVAVSEIASVIGAAFASHSLFG